MKKKSASHSAFFNPRVLLGVLIVLAGVSLALFAANPFGRGTARNQQQNQRNPYAVNAPLPDNSAPVHILSDALELPGPVKVEGADLPARVRALIPSVNALINNNNGSIGTAQFTQSETSTVAFGSTIVATYNDSGSFASGNHFTGWSRSTDNGVTWTDLGFLPSGALGDVGDPSIARDNTTGVLYLATLGFNGASVPNLDLFRSTDNGASWLAPINASPGHTGTQDKEWIAVDNFPGPGNGNIYLVDRDFGALNGIYLLRSTDGG